MKTLIDPFKEPFKLLNTMNLRVALLLLLLSFLLLLLLLLLLVTFAITLNVISISSGFKRSPESLQSKDSGLLLCWSLQARAYPPSRP